MAGVTLVLLFLFARSHEFWSWRLALPALFCLLTWKVGYRAWKPHEPPEPEQAPSDKVVQPLEPLALSREDSLRAAQLLLQNADLTHRINHDVRAGDDVLANSIERVLELPSNPGTRNSAPTRFYVPLLQVQRGALVDDLRHDPEISLLASSRARALTFKLLSFLTEAYFLGGETRGLSREQEALQLKIRDELTKLQPSLEADGTLASADDALTTAKLAIEALRGLTPLKPKDEWPQSLESILDLWEATFTTYVIFGYLEGLPGEIVNIRVSYAKALTVVEEPTAERRVERLKNSLRALCGLRQYVVRFPIPFANGCNSYHLRFLTAEDQYVYSARVIRDGHGADNAHLVVCQKDKSRTSNFAHVYLRPVRDVTSVAEPVVRLAMREKPPGVVGLVALIGVLQLVSQLVILYWYKTIFRGGGGPIDVAAFLLAAPGFVAAWIANQMTPGRLRRLSLTAAVGIGFNGFAAVAGVIFATLGAYQIQGFSIWRIRTGLGFERLWLVLLLLSFWVTGNIILRWAQNTTIFMQRLREPVTLDRYIV